MHMLLLPLQTYASQIRAMQVQFDKLQKQGNELADNESVGGRDTLRQELVNLRVLWEPLKDNVFDRCVHHLVLYVQLEPHW